MGSAHSQAVEGKRVVIVGGGFGGAQVAYDLGSKCKVTLISPNTFFDYRLGVLRSLVDADYAPSAIIDFQEFLPHAEFIQGSAVGLDDEAVHVTPVKGWTPNKKASKKSPKKVSKKGKPEPAGAYSEEEEMVDYSEQEEHDLSISSTEEASPRSGGSQRSGRSHPRSEPRSDGVRSEEAAVMFVPYDVLVIATGAAYPQPVYGPTGVTTQERLDGLRAQREELASDACRRIIIVGGGPVGVELAAELGETFRGGNKSIHLVHGGDELLGQSAPKMRTYSAHVLEQMGVHLHLGDRVMEEKVVGKNKIAVLKSGGELRYDKLVTCFGRGPITEWTRDYLGEAVEEGGRIRVDAHLQVDGHPNIYAVGDITNIQEEKMAFRTTRQAHICAHNILAALKHEGEGAPKLKSYESPSFLMIVSLGKNDGVMTSRVMTNTGFLPKMVKSGDMFVGKTRKGFGLRKRA